MKATDWKGAGIMALAGLVVAVPSIFFAQIMFSKPVYRKPTHYEIRYMLRQMPWLWGPLGPRVLGYTYKDLMRQA